MCGEVGELAELFQWRGDAGAPPASRRGRRRIRRTSARRWPTSCSTSSGSRTGAASICPAPQRRRLLKNGRKYPADHVSRERGEVSRVRTAANDAAAAGENERSRREGTVPERARSDTRGSSCATRTTTTRVRRRNAYDVPPGTSSLHFRDRIPVPHSLSAMRFSTLASRASPPPAPPLANERALVSSPSVFVFSLLRPVFFVSLHSSTRHAEAPRRLRAAARPARPRARRGRRRRARRSSRARLLSHTTRSWSSNASSALSKYGSRSSHASASPRSTRGARTREPGRHPGRGRGGGPRGDGGGGEGAEALAAAGDAEAAEAEARGGEQRVPGAPPRGVPARRWLACRRRRASRRGGAGPAARRRRRVIGATRSRGDVRRGEREGADDARHDAGVVVGVEERVGGEEAGGLEGEGGDEGGGGEGLPRVAGGGEGRFGAGDGARQARGDRLGEGHRGADRRGVPRGLGAHHDPARTTRSGGGRFDPGGTGGSTRGGGGASPAVAIARATARCCPILVSARRTGAKHMWRTLFFAFSRRPRGAALAPRRFRFSAPTSAPRQFLRAMPRNALAPPR